MDTPRDSEIDKAILEISKMMNPILLKFRNYSLHQRCGISLFMSQLACLHLDIIPEEFDAYYLKFKNTNVTFTPESRELFKKTTGKYPEEIDGHA